MDIKEAKQVVEKFKIEVELMRSLSQPEDTIPAEIFFNFMDILIPSFDVLITEATKNKEKEDVSK